MFSSGRIGNVVLHLWTSPNSLLGLLGFLLGRIGGARGSAIDGVLEVHGPGIERLLAACPVRFKVQAITFGHVVLGRDLESLDRTRAHERAHVHQYRCWGPAFLPAYVLASLLAWAMGGDAYLDNVFERQARAAEATSRDESMLRCS